MRSHFDTSKIKKRDERLGLETLNNQGCLMKIIEYNDCHNIVVEFQDKYKAKVHTDYRFFNRGKVKNPYYPSVYNVGMIGNKYPRSVNSKHTKEYQSWIDMLARCFDKTTKETQPAYANVSCCDEWLLFENFYEWLHSQSNFDKWLNGDRWHLDKDILVKGNKTYSPETCCLVPNNINALFTKRDICRGNLPIGVSNWRDRFQANCDNPFTGKMDYLGLHCTPLQAFQKYKNYKERIIKQVAQIEFQAENIIEQCYNAMMNYCVEIND